MPAPTRQEVEAIALLARLHLEPEELEQIRGDLGAILDHFAALADVPTDGVAPLAHVIPMDLRLRLDEPGPSLSSTEALAGAAAHDADTFVVPAIIGGGDDK